MRQEACLKDGVAVRWRPRRQVGRHPARLLHERPRGHAANAYARTRVNTRKANRDSRDTKENSAQTQIKQRWRSVSLS